MSTMINRALMVLRSLSIKTHAFSLCVIAGTLLLCAGFFFEPNIDFSHTTTNVSKDMETASASNLTIDIEVVSLCVNSNTDTEEEIEVNSLSIEDIDEQTSGSEFEISLDDYYEFTCLVEAEAKSEDLYGKTLVAGVVLNRVRSLDFPSDISSVINDPGQFDPVRTHYINYVEPSHDARQAVVDALNGVDNTQGALYFQKSKATEWGDKEFLYRYGSHSFYK